MQEQQFQAATEASNGDNAAAIVLSGSPDAVVAKKRKKRKGADDAAVQIKPVPADTDDASDQQHNVGDAIDLATAQSPLTEEERREIVRILELRKAERLTQISDFAAKASAVLEHQISEALEEQIAIQKRKREAAEAYVPVFDFDPIVALVESMANRGRALPSDYQAGDQEEDQEE
jgi:hypothetical protein